MVPLSNKSNNLQLRDREDLVGCERGPSTEGKGRGTTAKDGQRIDGDEGNGEGNVRREAARAVGGAIILNDRIAITEVW